MNSHLLPAHQVPSEKGSPIKGTNLLPLGVNSFFLEQTPFQKGQNHVDRIALLEIICSPLNQGNFLPLIVKGLIIDR